MKVTQSATDGTEKVLQPVQPGWQRRVNGKSFAAFQAAARKEPRRSIFGLPVMSPLCKKAMAWGFITTFVDLVYTSFLVPLSLAFNDYSTANFFLVWDFFGSAVYMADLFLEFHIGFLVRWDNCSVTIRDGRSVARNYILHGMFWIDLIAVLPIIAQIVLAAVVSADGMGASEAVRIVMLLKLLRLLRVVFLVSRMNKPEGAGLISQFLSTRVNSTFTFAVNTFFSLMVMVNLMASLWWWVAKLQGLENSWVAAVEINKPEINLLDTNNGVRWLVCAYFAICTVATIGYGDIVAVTTIEIALVLIFIFAGVAFFGFIVSTVTTLLNASPTGDQTHESSLMRMKQMESWMQRNGFPRTLRRDIRHYAFTHMQHSPANGEDSRLYGLLPPWLQVKAAMELQRGSAVNALFGGKDALEGLDDAERQAAAKAIASASHPVRLPRGAKLHALGDPMDCVYLVEEGQVALLFSGEARPVIMAAPAVMGAWALFGRRARQHEGPPPPWQSTAKAVTTCMFWKVEAVALERQLVATAPEALLLIQQHYEAAAGRALVGVKEAHAAAKSSRKLELAVEEYERRFESTAAAGRDLRESLKLGAAAKTAEPDLEGNSASAGIKGEEGDFDVGDIEDTESFYRMPQQAVDQEGATAAGIITQDDGISFLV